MLDAGLFVQCALLVRNSRESHIEHRKEQDCTRDDMELLFSVPCFGLLLSYAQRSSPTYEDYPSKLSG